MDSTNETAVTLPVVHYLAGCVSVYGKAPALPAATDFILQRSSGQGLLCRPDGSPYHKIVKDWARGLTSVDKTECNPTVRIRIFDDIYYARKEGVIGYFLVSGVNPRLYILASGNIYNNQWTWTYAEWSLNMNKRVPDCIVRLAVPDSVLEQEPPFVGPTTPNTDTRHITAKGWFKHG